MQSNTQTPHRLAEYARIGAKVGIALLFGYLLSRVFKLGRADQRLVSALRKRLEQAGKEVEKSLCPLTIDREKLVSDSNVSIQFKLTLQLEKKIKETISNPNNPFYPPFPKGMMISELQPSHRLLYNKFNIFKNHLLVVTKEPESQESPLSFEDMKQCALVVQVLNGCFFFNCGPNSGFSQKHKHIQILPNEAKSLPIMADLVDHAQNNQFDKLKASPLQLYKNFPFVHGIIRLNPCASPTKRGGEMLRAYEHMKTFFGALLKEPGFSFNLIGSKQFIMMVPRKKQQIFQQIGVNGVLFMGSILFKDPQLYEQTSSLRKPTELLKDVTYANI